MTRADLIRFIWALILFLALDIIFKLAFDWNMDLSSNLTLAAFATTIAAIREERK